MVPLGELWIPILVAAAFVFVASSILHMALPIHRGDYGQLPHEDEILEAFRKAGLTRGTYMFPCPGSMKEMATPEMQEKYAKGPVGFMTVLPNGPPAMGKSLLQWFLYCILVCLFAAYVATFSLERGTGFQEVFRVTGTVALLGFGVGPLVDSIWKGLPWGISLKFVFDGVVYMLAAGAGLAWLWPSA